MMTELEKAKRAAYNRAANETYRALTHHTNLEDTDDWQYYVNDWDEIADVEEAEEAGQQAAETAVDAERLFETDAEGDLHEVDDFSEGVEEIEGVNFFDKEVCNGTPNVGFVASDLGEAESLRLIINMRKGE